MALNNGSSPLTRGKLTLTIPVSCVIGLIPAHAGKTDPRPRRLQGFPAHPRSRGENPWHSTTSYSSGGSSPLTRGKRRADRPHGARRGLIPAHAGKTSGCIGGM